MRREVEETVEVVVGGFGAARVMLTCEHASENMPAGWSWQRDDAWLRGTHWSHDIGAANLTRELVARWGATGVLSRFTRLLADPNRPEGHPDMFRQTAEGRAVRMNQDLSRTDQETRLSRLYRSYHEVADTRIRSSSAEVLLAVHSFTPVYDNERRELEVGVLFDIEEDLARRVEKRLTRANIKAALNEPYSGKKGLMYSAARHARQHQKQAVEIEVRQDLIIDATFRERLADALTDVFF